MWDSQHNAKIDDVRRWTYNARDRVRKKEQRKLKYKKRWKINPRCSHLSSLFYLSSSLSLERRDLRSELSSLIRLRFFGSAARVGSKGRPKERAGSFRFARKIYLRVSLKCETSMVHYHDWKTEILRSSSN